MTPISPTGLFMASPGTVIGLIPTLNQSMRMALASGLMERAGPSQPEQVCGGIDPVRIISPWCVRSLQFVAP